MASIASIGSIESLGLERRCARRPPRLLQETLCCDGVQMLCKARRVRRSATSLLSDDKVPRCRLPRRLDERRLRSILWPYTFGGA